MDDDELLKRLAAEISAALMTLRAIRSMPQRHKRDVVGLVEAENHLEAAERALAGYLADRDKS